MMVDASKSDIEIYNIPAPGAKVDEHGELVDEDENLVEWMFMHQDFSLSMPYILADEITFYVE